MDDYFASYGDPGVHRLMIADDARTDAYRDAIEAVVKPGMVVMDVGAGTGILSLFAARAGAKRVHAIEASPIGPVIERLAEANGFGDTIIVHKTLVEDLKLDEPVDLIISEWMGYFGLAELMFESVLIARDRHMHRDGKMLPGVFRLKLFPVSDDVVHEVHGTGMWEDTVHGFDFKPMLELELADPMTTNPTLPRSAALGDHVTLMEIDLNTSTSEDFFFDEEIEMPVDCNGPIHGLGGYFEVDLGGDVTLSCSPNETETHWRQSWFPVRPFEAQVGDTLKVRMRAVRRETGDTRVPDYLTDGTLMRGNHTIHRFFYRHQGSFE
jgi:predicted RNA methylase